MTNAPTPMQRIALQKMSGCWQHDSLAYYPDLVGEQVSPHVVAANLEEDGEISGVALNKFEVEALKSWFADQGLVLSESKSRARQSGRITPLAEGQYDISPLHSLGSDSGDIQEYNVLLHFEDFAKLETTYNHTNWFKVRPNSPVTGRTH